MNNQKISAVEMKSVSGNNILDEAIGWLIKLLFVIIPSGLFASCFLYFDEVMTQQGSLKLSWPWSQDLGISLSFLLDGTGLLFLKLIGLVGSFVGFYSIWYFETKHLEKFFAPFFVFFFSMIGLVISDDLIVLFIFWEATSLSSFFLIGFKHELEVSRKAALQALLITGIGGLFLLAGISILAFITNSFSISDIIQNADNFKNHDLLPAAFVLIFIGCMTKSAQWPFHFWLPGSMSAPAPASAFLHSATMVKAGIFLLLKVSPVFGHLDLWKPALMIVGSITFIWPLITSNFEDDAKSVLANTTVSSLGLMTLLIGYNTEFSLMACLLFLFAHALYKSCLFLCIGLIEKKTGYRSMNNLSALVLKMPKMFLVFLVATICLLAVAPSFSFIAKEFILEAFIHKNDLIMTAIVFFGSSLSVCVAISLFVSLFLKEKTWKDQYPKIQNVIEAKTLFLIPCFALGGMGLLAGLFPNWTLDLFLRQPLSVFSNQASELRLSLWHGLNKALLVSLSSLALGIILAFWQRPFRDVLNGFKIKLMTGADLFDHALKFILKIGRKITFLTQNESLSFYIVLLLLSYLGVSLVFISSWDSFRGLSIWNEPDWLTFAIALMMIFFSVTLALTKQTVKSVVCLAVIGFSVAILFGINSAPDLALTQIAVESLVLILIANSLPRLPKMTAEKLFQRRAISFVTALLCGFFASGLTYVILSNPTTSKVSPYFWDNSLNTAFGANVVNVILVDFRGFDTLGEITVLVIAAIGITQLIKLKKKRHQTKQEPSS